MGGTKNPPILEFELANHFLSEDKEKAISFLNFLIKNAKWEISTTEAMDLNKNLIWFQTMIKKIEDHVFELLKVHEPVPEAKKSK